MLCITPVAAQAGSTAERELQTRLARHVATMKKDQSVIRFFETHRWLLSDPRFSEEAKLRLSLARRNLATSRARAAKARAALAARREAQRQAALLRSSPKAAICHAFGRYCGQALAVARCESGLRTTAVNGQYLGLFQMGSSERRLFGHGSSPLAQARAAHRYFVASGRDWSPWSCKPWW